MPPARTQLIRVLGSDESLRKKHNFFVMRRGNNSGKLRKKKRKTGPAL
jgi:hypothetical protein